MAEKIISPRYSFRGWRMEEWFIGNWSTIKELLKVGIPALIGWITTHNPVLAGFITILGKFILDSGEYFFKKYTA